MRGSHAASLGSTHSADGYGLLVRRDGVEVWSKPSDEISGRITSTQEAQSLGVMVADPGVYDAVECDYVEEPGSYGSIGSVTSNIGTQYPKGAIIPVLNRKGPGISRAPFFGQL